MAVMLSAAKHLAFQSLTKTRSFGYRLRMTLRHSLCQWWLCIAERSLQIGLLQ